MCIADFVEQPCRISGKNICLILLILLKHACDATNRFGHHEDPFLGRVVATRPQVRSEVEEVLISKYRSDTAGRLSVLAKEMRPTYLALPKTAQGYLGAPATRYLLHRHFLRSRAWLVKGIAPDGGAWNASRPTAILNYSTTAARELFEQRFQSRGLDLQEVVLLAAMIENNVHQDAVRRLRKGWTALNLPKDTPISTKDMERALDVYMMSYVIQDADAVTPELLDKDLKKAADVYPKWEKIKAKIHAIFLRTVASGRREFSFNDAEQAVVEISERYSELSLEDCEEIKADVLPLEGNLPGRVPLTDFFWNAVHAGKYHFGESVSFLRHTGILDETDPAHPNIVIPNYVASPSQLVFTADTFALGCMDGCEHILSQIESIIKSPYSTPERIASAVGGIASSTQSERSSGLPEILLSRLKDITRQDSVQKEAELVPLHGRLFAQWLHHAFPRECPFPHVSTSGVELLLPSVFQERIGPPLASEMEKQQYASRREGPDVNIDRDELPWDTTEELLAPRITIRPPLIPEFVLRIVKYGCCLGLFLILVSNLTLFQEIFNATGANRVKIIQAMAGGSGSCVASKLY